MISTFIKAYPFLLGYDGENMKIEKIGDNIIRVTISYNDLEERNVDLNALNYNTPAAQEFLYLKDMPKAACFNQPIHSSSKPSRPNEGYVNTSPDNETEFDRSTV
jgi:hypothetical protein